MKNELDYIILASGSTGNAVRIRNIMFDCGISFAKMKEELYKCDYLFITHTHLDHINPTTLKKIKEFFPNIKIISNKQVWTEFNTDIFMCEYQQLKINKGDVVTAFICPHNVDTFGYVIEFANGENLIYATDCWNLDRVPEKIKFDYCFIESNYDEDKVKQIQESGNSKKLFGYNIIENAFRHLSKQKCKEFYYTRRKDKEALLVELHKSSRFY